MLCRFSQKLQGCRSWKTRWTENPAHMLSSNNAAHTHGTSPKTSRRYDLRGAPITPVVWHDGMWSELCDSWVWPMDHDRTFQHANTFRGSLLLSGEERWPCYSTTYFLASASLEEPLPVFLPQHRSCTSSTPCIRLRALQGHPFVSNQQGCPSSSPFSISISSIDTLPTLHARVQYPALMIHVHW